MNARRPLDGKATGLMLLLCTIWGLQQIALKASAPDMAPMLQIGLRSGMAAVAVGIFLRAKGLGVLPGGGALPAGMLAGTLFALEYIFVGEGLCFTTAGHMSVMLYTAPAFAALGLHFRIPEERLSFFQWCGMFVAFSGVVIMFYAPARMEQSVRDIVWGDFLGLLAGVAWGATTVVIRTSRLAEVPAAQTVFIQLIAAFIILLGCSVFWGDTGYTVSKTLIVSLVYQTIIVSFISFMVWFWLLRVYLASRLGVLSFLTPVFGVIFSILLLDETIDVQFVAGTTCILVGILLVSGWQLVKKAFCARETFIGSFYR